MGNLQLFSQTMESESVDGSGHRSIIQQVNQIVNRCRQQVNALLKGSNRITRFACFDLRNQTIILAFTCSFSLCSGSAAG